MTNSTQESGTDLIALWLGDVAHGDVAALGHQLGPAAGHVVLHLVHLHKIKTSLQGLQG